MKFHSLSVQGLPFEGVAGLSCFAYWCSLTSSSEQHDERHMRLAELADRRRDGGATKTDLLKTDSKRKLKIEQQKSNNTHSLSWQSHPRTRDPAHGGSANPFGSEDFGHDGVKAFNGVIGSADVLPELNGPHQA
eukprot:1728590-Amphidinium_carterae.2